VTKLKDITVLDEIYNPHANGYMVTGKLKDSASEKPYILGWRTRKGQTLIEPQTYKSKGWLTRSFQKAISQDQWPDNEIFRRDTHQQRLYDWENACLVPQTIRVSEKKAREVIKRVCSDYNIERTMLRWRPDNEGKPSLYDPSEHSIEFRHRDLVSLLHELGHAIHEENGENDKGPHHSPAFTRILLELYNRYAGFNIDYLVITAQKFDLLGDTKSNQIISDPASPRRLLYSHR
jgi:hypothetical protein